MILMRRFITKGIKLRYLLIMAIVFDCCFVSKCFENYFAGVADSSFAALFNREQAFRNFPLVRFCHIFGLDFRIKLVNLVQQVIAWNILSRHMLGIIFAFISVTAGRGDNSAV